MQQTIYLGLKPLILATSAPEHAQENILIEAVSDPNSIKSLLTRLEQDATVESAVMVHPDTVKALEEIKRHFQFIQAAGGLVVSDKEQILLIFRRGKWDLPKGKLDPGETLEQCAIREVEEETGVNGIKIVQPLGSTWHTYYQEGQHILKESVWYLMKAPHKDNLEPQSEEDIAQCIWVTPEQVSQYLSNTYRTIADVLQKSLPILSK